VPAQARKRGLPGWAIALIVVGAVVVLLCAGGAVFAVMRISGAPRPSVRVTSCSTTIGDFTTSMSYTVRNNDKVPHDYTVFGTIGDTETQGLLRGVEPDQTAAGHLEGPSQGNCRITRVEQR
jgi:hypothetical protein